MNPNHRHLLRGAVAAAAILSIATPAAAQFVTYGPSCGLTNSADTEPYLGMTYRLRTTGAPAGSLVLGVLGLSPANLPLSFLGSPCTLLASPDVIELLIPSGSGEAELAIEVPQNPALLGLQVFDQWIAFDPNGVLTASAGGVGTIANPQLQVLGVVAPPLVVPGSPVTITARNVGTRRPQDLCIGLFSSSTGERGLIRATNIQPIGGNDVQIQGVVTTPAPGDGHVMVMRGDGNELMGPIPGGHGDWGWTGPNLAEAGGMGGPTVTAPPPPFHLRFVANAGDVVVEVPASTPASGNARADAHWNAGNKHYDSFLSPVAYTGLTPTQFRDTVLLPILQTRYDTLYPGLLQITADTIGGNPAVRIHMVDNSSCSSVGGSVWF